MARVDAAEKEASEVLHSLLSVERIVKPEQRVIVEQVGDPTGAQFQTAQGTVDANDPDAQIQWHTPVSISHSLFSAIETNNQFPQTIDEQQVVCIF